MRLPQKILSCCIFVVLFFSMLSPGIAAEPFRTDLTLSYTVADDGTTSVVHDYTITNQSPTTFINKYALKTSFRRLRDVRVTEQGKTLEANIAETDAGTSIGFSFPEDVVGQNKQRVFSISYTTTDIAVVGGKALEVHIPQITDQADYQSVSMKIVTPAKFGAPVYHSAGKFQVSQDESTVTTTLSEPAEAAISLLYGDTQYYFLSLRYHLENTTGSPGITQVALPPDTSFQRMHYHTIEPSPERLEKDSDGNWIATYTLPPTSNTTLHLSAIAKITLEPDQSVPVIQPTRKHQAAQEFWETESGVVQEHAAKFVTPEAIYSHVVETLQYAVDFETIPKRKGAAASLQQPEGAVCQEFTDAFIGLSRANNIPARRLTGYAYTQNAELRPLSFAGDILHAWPEFYDQEKKLWRPVDPTWGHTTRGVDYFNRFDLNHIVFAINGVSSTIPYPAGAYKLESLESKDIEVSFANEFPAQKNDLAVSVEQAQFFGIALPGQYSLVMHNQSGQAWYDITTEIAQAAPAAQTGRYHIEHLLPFQVRRIPVTLHSDDWLTPLDKQTARVTIRSAASEQPLYDREFTQLTTSPKVLTPFTSVTGSVALGIGAVTLALAAGSVLVFRRRRKRAVRR